MPCYQVQRVSVEFKAENRQLLDKAIQALGWSAAFAGHVGVLSSGIQINLETNIASFPRGQEGTLNQLKRAYSMEAVKLAAKLGRWQVRQTGNKGQLVRSYL